VLLTPIETTRIAADMTPLFSESATILRATDSRDAIGGRSQSWATVATVSCRVKAEAPKGFGASDLPFSDAQKDKTLFRVAFPIGTDVRLTDRVGVLGLTLAVQGIVAPTSLALELVTTATRAFA
jgi:head-tail adaptor